MLQSISKLLGQAELATILAALRFYQKALERNSGEPPGGVFDIATNDDTIEALSVDQIDELCERINN